jgi:uncharacterized membrane protein
MSLLVALHLLAAVIWVGGMFFAYMVLRPSAGPLEPPSRLALWRRVFGRFFPWVWASIVVLLLSGYAMLFWHFGGFAGAPLHVNIMQATGLLMTLLFMHLFFALWRRFSRAVDAGTWPDAAASLDQIRRFVATNLVLGLITVAVASSGRFWA